MSSDPLNSLLPAEERFQYLSQALTLVENGEATEGSLGRHLRLSTIAHKTITDTISQSVESATEDPSESVEAFKTIARCNKMLKLCGKLIQPILLMSLLILTKLEDRPPKDFFPFTELPREVRDMIYKLVFGLVDLDGRSKRPWTYARKVNRCQDKSCCPYSFGFPNSSKLVDSAIMATNQLIRSESAPVFYRERKFYLFCLSKLATYISRNCYFRANAIDIKVYWHGSDVEKAFSLIGKCDALENFSLLVTKDTTSNKTVREKFRMVYFPNSSTRLYDTLGIEELLALRGLKDFHVSSSVTRPPGQEVKDEVPALEALLRSKVLLPRPA